MYQKMFNVAIIYVFVAMVFSDVGISRPDKASPVQYSALNCRKHSAVLTDFGGVGDGKTMNTKAFKKAMAKMSKFENDGGAELIVPAGKWLTGAFNITISHFTLFLAKDAVILASQNEADWPVIAPLPSYGKGRESDGGRYGSLISGTNLTDIVITGNNGTIDGQGQTWWEKFKQKKMKHTRPYLIEIMHTDQLQISNITVTNSPSWHIHPTYCKNVIIQWVTVLAPVDVPNTDGINPDSCSNIRIEDCFLQSGDDCIAVKSGWDQYAFANIAKLKAVIFALQLVRENGWLKLWVECDSV
ncbi:Pectin lyase-like superfamily protein [Euphorbia peplus]|nr:Pectin lyase-like superfamily protein [Euphorbia peplus]